MNFVADEDVDCGIVERLRQDGHRVWYVAEMAPSISDDMVLGIANREAALLLTADKDFGEMVFRQHRFAGGIVLIRLAGVSAARKGKWCPALSTGASQNWLEALLSSRPESAARVA